MTPAFGLRLLRQTTPRTLHRFAWNFGWRGMRAIQRFDRQRRRGTPAWPPFLFISVTRRCNLDCEGCWVVGSRPVDMDPALLDRILREATARGTTMFGILGGEPLLYDGLFDVLARHPRAYFLLFTNGTLLSPEHAARLRALGNVSPLISIEGLAAVSDQRRGGQDVYARSMAGLRHCTAARLVTGIATSVCRSNLDELATPAFVRAAAAAGAHYLWYYLYRPAGARPGRALLLDADQVVRLRRFLVESRRNAPLLIVDAYWDHEGRALCPAVTGISCHISPEGDIEPCPVVQMAADRVGDGNDLGTAIAGSTFLPRFAEFAAQTTRGCVLMADPVGLAGFMAATGARDTSGRDRFRGELEAAAPCACHHLPGREIPEQSLPYRFAKKHWFFGFGAYG